MAKKKTKKKVAPKKRSKKWIDPVEQRHRDMLGLNGEKAYESTYGY